MSDVETIRPRRSFLFAPATNPDMFSKAIAAKPDIFCVDMEDAVAPQHKEDARQATLDWFEAFDNNTGTELCLRVNELRSIEGFADVQALVKRSRTPDAIMMPKVKSPDDIRIVDEIFTAESCAIRIQVIIETNEGLEAVHEIARASERVDAILFGGIDMSAELRVDPTWEALLYARQRLVHAAAGAGIDVLDVPYLDLENLQGLGQEASRSAAIGMTGKGAIHHKQLAIIEECFSPSPRQIEHARRIVKAFEETDGGQVVIDGRSIEKPVLRKMHHILAVADFQK